LFNLTEFFINTKTMDIRLNLNQSSIKKKRGISFFDGRALKDFDILNQENQE